MRRYVDKPQPKLQCLGQARKTFSSSSVLRISPSRQQYINRVNCRRVEESAEWKMMPDSSAAGS
ncbi:unnamed protein product, partial [Nesidiocoris tenuis]